MCGIIRGNQNRKAEPMKSDASAKSLAKKIQDMGGTCEFHPTPRHIVLLEESDGGVEVSVDEYPEGAADDAEPTASRTESFDSVEAAVAGFRIDGKPLVDYGCEPKPPVTPA